METRAMANPEQGNQTSITEFILLGFGTLPELRILFLVFLMIYIATMAINLLIVALVVADQNLHTPMYFFLGNLSCLETCYTSTLLPRMLTVVGNDLIIALVVADQQLHAPMYFFLANCPAWRPARVEMLASLLTGDRTISVSGCLTQYYFFGFLAVAESYLLAVMSYDWTIMIVYMLPKTDTLRDLNKVFSIFYTVLTPMVNPLIYSLRNREVKEILGKVVTKFCAVKRVQTVLP
ncbi:unnamed protein product [Caretta caretta]